VNVLTRLIAGVLAAIFPAALFAQSPPAPAAIDQLARLQAELRRAHDSGDAAAYLATARSMYSFLNGSPRGTLQLMSAESFAGRTDEALHSFSQFVAMGQANEEVLKAKSFDPLRGLVRYQDIYAGMAANARSESTGSEVFRLDGAALIPEDIDYDPDSRHFYISTVLGKQILQLDAAGRTKSFATAPDQWPMMALKVDSRRRLLWATEVALDGFAAAAKQDWGRSAILQYDLRSGKLLHRIEGPPQAALGDMVLATNGDPIVSDGEHGGVYRVNGSTLSTERIDAGDFVSPQTPVALPDATHLLVPDYVRGLGMLDLNSKHVDWIPMDGKHALSGIDGLYAAGNLLLATQNGASPERVVRFALTTPKDRVLSESIIERATPTLGDPTHGVVVGRYFYYIANSGWNVLDEHGNLLEGKSLPPSSVMRAKII
jgi:sugar lactone lactonase YvrE